MSNYKAVNAFIFAGSFSIGVMDAGFDLDRVLEMTDDMLEKNAFYFHKNYPKIPVIIPKDWENDEYLAKLKKENIDIMCCNCPCSSLSRVNRYAKFTKEKNNVHFYRLFNIFEKAQPKVFVIENAPTLIKMGFPILADMVERLKSIYRFTIVRDMAGNHNVPMRRMRTIVIGWRKDVFDKTPIIEMDKHKQMSIKEALQDVYDMTLDDECPWEIEPIKALIKYSITDHGLLASLAMRWNNGEKDCIEDCKKYLPGTVFEKTIFPNMCKKVAAGEGYWDKSPKRMGEDKPYPSFSGPQQYLHPVLDRCLNSFELKRLMGYPDGFDVSDPDKKCKVERRVALAQGVPVNFGKYVASQVKKCLDGDYESSDAEVVFQNNNNETYQEFNTYNDFINLTEIDSNIKGKKLNK